MKYRLSPKIAGFAITGGVLSVALWYGILPDLEEARVMNQPGEIVFPGAKPTYGKGETRPVTANFGNGNSTVAIGELFDEGWENLMRWKYNPWRIGDGDGYLLGGNFHKLLASDDPADVAKARDIQRRAEFWMKKLMERYPELSITPRPVPDERNGFLKWLELSERFRKENPGKMNLPGLSEVYSEKQGEEKPWDPQAARDWLKANAALMDELRTIGLLPDASTEGITVDRYGFIPARLAIDCADALMMEARLAAESGDVAAAMESISAVRGLASHFENVEYSGLLQVTVRIMIQMRLEQRVFSEILPALPEGSQDPAVWEGIVKPRYKPPSDFARIMKGEWSVTLREYVLPPILDPADPKSPPDPGALLDAYSRPYAELVKSANEIKPNGDLPGELFMGPETAGLSRTSRQMIELLFIGARAWNQGSFRAENSHALTLAAFTVMKDGTVPVDPVRGLPYRWDPATRTLSMPDTPEFDGMKIKPVVVPKR